MFLWLRHSYSGDDMSGPVSLNLSYANNIFFQLSTLNEAEKVFTVMRLFNLSQILFIAKYRSLHPLDDALSWQHQIWHTHRKHHMRFSPIDFTYYLCAFPNVGFFHPTIGGCKFYTIATYQNTKATFTQNRHRSDRTMEKFSGNPGSAQGARNGVNVWQVGCLFSGPEKLVSLSGWLQLWGKMAL